MSHRHDQLPPYFSHARAGGAAPARKHTSARASRRRRRLEDFAGEATHDWRALAVSHARAAHVRMRCWRCNGLHSRNLRRVTRKMQPYDARSNIHGCVAQVHAAHVRAAETASRGDDPRDDAASGTAALCFALVQACTLHAACTCTTYNTDTHTHTHTETRARARTHTHTQCTMYVCMHACMDGWMDGHTHVEIHTYRA